VGKKGGKNSEIVSLGLWGPIAPRRTTGCGGMGGCRWGGRKEGGDHGTHTGEKHSVHHKVPLPSKNGIVEGREDHAAIPQKNLKVPNAILRLNVQQYVKT